MSNVYVDFVNLSGKRQLSGTDVGRGDFSTAVSKLQKTRLASQVVRYINGDTGEVVKGPLYDVVEQDLRPNDKHILQQIDLKEPTEPAQHEPRDRTMSEINKFKKMIKECLTEHNLEKNPRARLKESLRGIVQNVLNEISNVTKPEPDKEEKETISKGYRKDGNQRLDKDTEKQLKELETIIHGINSDWDAYWDDHNQLIVRAENLLYVRICPKFENSYDVDAMVKMVDRVRAISLTWDQVKAFVKANFSDLEKGTKADSLVKKSVNNHKDGEVIKKDAGPEGQKVKPRYQDPENGKIKDTKKDDKNYNEKFSNKEEDQPDQPMKKVTEPGKDPESKNKNIEKTTKVSPPKHKGDKNDKKLRVSDKKTTKFKAKKSD